MWDNILLALQSLRANKMRSILTMLGIIIGIGSVITIKTVGSSLSGTISDSMSGYGISNITVSLTQKESSDEMRGGGHLRMFMNSDPGDSDLMTDEMLAEFRAAFPDTVNAIELTCSVGSVSVDNKTNDDTSSMTVTGVNDEYAAVEGVELIYGRWLQNETDAGKKLCVVSDYFVKNCLGISYTQALGYELPLSLSAGQGTYYICGIYHYDEESSGGISMVSSGSETVTNCYIPLKTAQILTGTSTAGYQSITVACESAESVNATLSTIEEYFSSYYTRNDTWTVECSSMESLVSSITEILDTLSLAISAIAAISLLVGGIGVMNIMMVSITERTREIGTRKALGAPPATIRVQFIVEAIVICLIGGIIGISVGIGLGAIACKILGYSARADISTIALAVGFSMAIGVFFGYYPANRAAKMDPIEALRYE